MSKSSDQRYFQVRRTKRHVDSHDGIIDAIRSARLSDEAWPALESAVAASASEFTHVMLACGRTSTDFRCNVLRGCADHNLIKASEIEPYDNLLAAKLDGYSLLRLSQEQHWNVKQRWAKLREQDVIIHDSQGSIWIKALRAAIDGPKFNQNVVLLDIQADGQRLVAKRNGDQQAVDQLLASAAHKQLSAIADDLNHYAPAIERITKELERGFRGEANATRLVPEFSDVAAWNIALRKLKDAYDLHRAYLDDANAEIRVGLRIEIEKRLVVAEAYVAGDDIRAAIFDPDTSNRHGRDASLKNRIERTKLRMEEIEKAYSTNGGASERTK